MSIKKGFALVPISVPLVILSVTSAVLDEQTYAVFGQASYRPVEPLTLTAGLRYEIFNSTLEDSEAS